MGKSQKELDKDMMFQKIMPVLKENPFSNLPQDASAEESASPEIAALRSRLPHVRSITQPEHPMPRNVMELAVDDVIDSVIHKFNCCPCNRCRCDVAAIALNALPVQYMTGSEDVLREAARQVESKTVYNALIKAVLQVRSHPNH